MIEELEQLNDDLEKTVHNLQVENERLKEELEVSKNNEEAYKLEMLDITKRLGLDEETLFDDVKDKAERLNNIINELEKSKEKQINEYEILILKIERYLNCYQYFLETQEENNKKIANMIHDFSLGSDKE